MQDVELQKTIAMQGQGTLDKYVVTAEMCDEECAKVIASAGLPLQITDNKNLRKLLSSVAKCGSKYLKGNDDVHLSHSTNMTDKVLTKVDKDLENPRARGCHGCRTWRRYDV